MDDKPKKRSPRIGRKFAVQQQIEWLEADSIKDARWEAGEIAMERAAEVCTDTTLRLLEYVGTVTARLPEAPDPVVVWGRE